MKILRLSSTAAINMTNPALAEILLRGVATLKMKLQMVAIAWGIAPGTVLAGLLLTVSVVGCGGGRSSTSTSTPASITSFTASQASVAAGASVSLTGVFSNGAGVITPGGLSVTSGTPVNVSPAATTTYTLTVTPSSGAPATAETTVTVNPAPSITSFTASQASVAAGVSVSLTGVFSNGAGVITPGGLAVTSGMPVNVSPASTTTYTLTVTNPSETAISQTTTVTVNPAPAITSLSPISATAGQAAFTLTVIGLSFTSGATVKWNGSALSTNFVSSSQLTASVPASQIASVGSASVAVMNPGGGTSSGVTFPIDPPIPAITTLSPTSSTAGGTAFNLTLNGTGFQAGATASWDGSALPTTFVSSTQLTASIAASLIATLGSATVTVSGTGGTSNGVTFTIKPALPAIASLSPVSAAAGGAGFNLTLNGTGFQSGAAALWNGSAVPTTFVNSTQLTASVSSSQIAAAGTATVTVANPDGATSNFGDFFIPGWTTLATVYWEVDNDEYLTINNDGSWTLTDSGGKLPYGIPANNPQQSGSNWAGFSQQAPFPPAGTIASGTSNWNVQVISGQAPRSCCIGSGSNPQSSVSVISYAPTSITIQATDYVQNRVSFTLQISYYAIPLVNGGINPKYKIMGVTYAPPGGNTNSFASYQNTNIVGNTTTITQSISNAFTMSVGVDGKYGTGTTPLYGVGGGFELSGQVSSGWTQESDSSNAVTVNKQNSTTLKTPGDPTVYSPVDHDYDIIWLWLNPVVLFSVPETNTSAGGFILWNGYGFDLNDPLQDIDVWPVYVGYLNGDFGPLDAQDADALSRSWVTGQTFAPGDGPGITSADYPSILGADPFAYNPYDQNSGYVLSLAPGTNPPTSTDGRFTMAEFNNTTPQSIPYKQAGLDSTVGEQETYLDQYTTINTTSQTTSYSYYVGFSLDDKFGGSFFGNSVQYELKESWTTTWKDSIQTSLTTTSQQTDTAQITGPPCPTTAPPCTPEFAEPHEFSVFQDNLYGTFMYWPNPYFTIGTAPTSTNSGYGSAPASQTVSAGGSTSFSFPSTSNAGYTGTSISFTVTGLPSGASYTPGTVAPGNVFGLDVSTMPSTPKGTYPLTITATDGSQSFLAYATLVVN